MLLDRSACWTLVTLGFFVLVAPSLLSFRSHGVNVLAGPPPTRGPKLFTSAEKTAPYWNRLAQDALRATLQTRLNENVAKNIILFLGDGMGVATVTASRIFKGQMKGNPGEEDKLEFEKFPHVALIKTYNVDRQVPDSAGTSTAYLCGVKANYETVGVDARARHGDCESSIGTEVPSILKWAQDGGKDTGFVTTTRVTHASPAGLYAHSPYRYWEADFRMPENASRCKDIAAQLVEDIPGKNIKVIMGGGRPYFLPENELDVLTHKIGFRKDGKNLINTWKRDKERRGKVAKYVYKSQDFFQLDVEETDYLLGLFDYNHMQYESSRPSGPDGQPSLAEMTKRAIQMLRKNPKGFFLFVEGGRIDHAHHDGLARISLEETIAFQEAVKVAAEMTSEDDTLIAVTADHSHVMTINGYPLRGNSILGLAMISDVDNLPYTTLMYTNGPGYPSNGTTRANLTDVNTASRNFTPQVAVRLREETHGGEDVAIYARGPMAHLFTGVQEQNYIPHALAYAACIGSNLGHCRFLYNATPITPRVLSSKSLTSENGRSSASGRTSAMLTWNTVINLLITLLVAPLLAGCT